MVILFSNACAVFVSAVVIFIILLLIASMTRRFGFALVCWSVFLLARLLKKLRIHSVAAHGFQGIAENEQTAYIHS